MENNSLTHWGIKGMRWGIRRYQNKDGSLTPAGEKRRARLEAELKSREKVIKNKERTRAKLAKLDAKQAELEAREAALKSGKKTATSKLDASDKTKASNQKSVKDMTDDELREHTSRMRLESDYLNAQKNLAAATPQKVSAGKKFMSNLVDNVVMPAATNAGKAWLEKTLKDKLGLTEEKKMSVDDMAKKFKLEQDKKNEKLDDLRREIAIIEAQKRLDRERAKQGSGDSD